MTSGKRENSVHVRLSDEADATLDLLRAADGRDKSALAAVLLERVLLGEGHALRVAAERFVRSGLSGSGRDAQGG